MPWTDHSFLAALYFISEWIIRLVMLMVVPFRRSPDAAKGWLIFVFFLPWPGLLLYWMIGRPVLPRWRNERLARMPAALAPVITRLKRSSALRVSDLKAELAPAVRLAHNLGDFDPLDGNAVEVLVDYDGILDRIAADIDAARDHVHLLFYIFGDGGAVEHIHEALERAVRRGVSCRVLLDWYGSKKYRVRVLARLRAAGVEAHEALPVGWMRRSARFDLRNHRKIAVIDGRVAYTGSQNLVDARFKKGLEYEESMVRVVGPAVLELQAVFISDWFLETEEVLNRPTIFPEPEVAGTVAAQALPSGPGFPTENTQQLDVALLHAARERVVITTPYFIPDAAVLQALKTAVLRGVDVHLVVARQIDQFLVGFAQRSYYDELLEAGIHIHQYRARFLHAKHVSFDDQVALIGSSNIDIRSFVLNAEISMVFYDSAVTGRLRQEQERYFRGSDMLDLKSWRERPLAVRFCENLARLVSPLL